VEEPRIASRLQPVASTSLAEVHSSVATEHGTLLKRMFAFAGPAYLVSVGYMDPGNWATDLEGGARFGYQLLWILVLSNLMAILLQTLSARLGIVSGRDLAQACRESYPAPVSYALWLLCEVAIAACDLAEVLGAAIALKLLFHIPLLTGVVLTALDTFLVMWLSRYGIRVIEGMILSLIALITACFLVELFFARPALAEVFSGLAPRLTDESLYAAIGILGATVMPHNLYLHSALVQTRQIGRSSVDKAKACRFNLLDSVIALNGALVVNVAILVMAAAVFFKKAIVVTQIEQAHQLLEPLLGTGLASILFAVALLASGQSSTLTGTFAGQIVMEGFLDVRLRPWLRRLMTRSVAIAPAVATIYYLGEKSTYSLFILSQVILSMQLPFAVMPLIRFTSDPHRMGEFANRTWVKILAWSCAAIIVGLNLRLVSDAATPWIAEAPWRGVVLAPVALSLLGLLAYVTFAKPRASHLPVEEVLSAKNVIQGMVTPRYTRILVPLDHSGRDRSALGHAAAIAREHGASLHLLHVEEGAISRLYGPIASGIEVEAGKEYFETIIAALLKQGLSADLTVLHGQRPKDAIVTVAREKGADLIVMGAHGHRGFKDMVFGNTINGVRHLVNVPVLVVGDAPQGIK
jgi:manganese transport protein